MVLGKTGALRLQQLAELQESISSESETAQRCTPLYKNKHEDR